VPLSVGAAGSSSNSVAWADRPTSAPIRDILIHPAVWPQYTNVTDRQTDRQDNGPVAQGEPLLVTVRQNMALQHSIIV